MNIGKNRIVSSDIPFDYRRFQETAAAVLYRYKFLKRDVIGKSYLGKNIDLISLGNGAHKVIYIGSHHGMEWITSLILMRFIENFCQNYTSGANYYGYNLDYIFNTRTIYVVPMLNPDGVDLAINGIDAHNPVKERLVAINGGSSDFSRWQANARGVDLNHNYDADWEELRKYEQDSGIDFPSPTRFGGEYPESESETQSLASFIRSEEDIKLLLALHTQGEEIYWKYKDALPPKAKEIAENFAKSTGYKLSYPTEQIASCGGCKDWFISAFNRPAFTFECGLGVNPLPLSSFMQIFTATEESLLLGAVL